LDAIEWVRVAAACGVVWFHVAGGPGKQLGYAGLICFILIAVVFQAAGAEKDAFAAYFWKKSIRIIPPWLFWFGFYGLFNAARGKALFPYSTGLAANVLTGPWIGLWFLPFILLTSGVVYGLARATACFKPLALAAGSLAIGMVALGVLPHAPGLWPTMNHPPWSQWIHALPALPIGLGVHGVMKTTGATRLIAMMVLLTVVETVCIDLWDSSSGVAILYGVAVLVVGVGYLIPSRLPCAVTRFGGLCLGVYLVHSCVMSGLKIFPVAREAPWLLFAATVVLSFSLTSLMRRNRWFVKVL